MTIKEILERLVTARKHAGLKQMQTAKLIQLSHEDIHAIEEGLMPLEMGVFLKLCEIYSVSEIWVLTGVNPYFDPASVVEAAEYQGMPKDDLGNLIEALAMQRQSQ